MRSHGCTAAAATIHKHTQCDDLSDEINGCDILNDEPQSSTITEPSSVHPLLIVENKKRQQRDDDDYDGGVEEG